MSPVSSKFNRMQNKKLSCCCDSRSAKETHYCVFLFLTLFIVIAASRPVNKNVSTGAVIWAKCGTEPGVHKQLANYQTAGTTFIPVHRPWEPQCRALQTDRRTVNSQSDCVAVRSAKKYHFKMLNVTLVLDIFCRYIVHGIQTHVAFVFSYVASLLI